MLLAHTFLTHRRALARVGEARRAGELTQAAVSIARSAVDEGLERRAADAPSASPRASVLVAGVVPPIGDEPDTRSGRLGERATVDQRDFADHAGLMADAGVDLILVEHAADAAGTALAARAAVETGLPAWVSIPHLADSAESARWLEALAPLAPARLIVADPGEAIDPEPLLGTLLAVAALSGGLLLTAPPIDMELGSLASAWLAAGAAVIGLADAATPEFVATLRRAIDDHVAAEDARAAEATSLWRHWVEMATERAPRGAAAWIADAPPPELPDGWKWSVVPPSDVHQLPRDRFSLIVAEEALELESLAARLEPGGILVAPLATGQHVPDGLRQLERRERDGRTELIGRREGS